MKDFALLLLATVLFAGCATSSSYKANLPAGTARAADYPIPLYNEGVPVPRPCELIGQISINASSYTMRGGSLEDEMKEIMRAAHEKGADVVQLTSVDKPDFGNVNYRIQAGLLRYADHWERVLLSEKDFLAYLQQHHQTLDPIEGLWFDGATEQIGIIRDHSRPGRDFIAFTLGSARPNWLRGYKKMDIARALRPGAYNVTYYTDDFSPAATSTLLEGGRAFSFNVQKDDAAYPVTFIKINPAAAAP